MTDAPLRKRAGELRQAFDDSFAQAPLAEAAPLEDFLAIRLADAPYALRLNELSRLLTIRRITPVPSSAPGLLGLLGVSGNLVPAYDLGVLLGHPPTDAGRWIGLVGQKTLTGFLIDGMEGFLRLPHDALARLDGKDSTAFVQEALRLNEGLIRPVVHLPSVLASLKKDP